jgi:hypothetical protein
MEERENCALLRRQKMEPKTMKKITKNKTVITTTTGSLGFVFVVPGGVV